VLDTADAELAAHIIAHSVASLDSSSSSNGSRSSSRAGGVEQEASLQDLLAGAAAAAGGQDAGKVMSKFLRDFEPQALDLGSIGWGMSGDGSTSRWVGEEHVGVVMLYSCCILKSTGGSALAFMT
jgi:hypothetical protein